MQPEAVQWLGGFIHSNSCKNVSSSGSRYGIIIDTNAMVDVLLYGPVMKTAEVYIFRVELTFCSVVF